MFWKRKEGNEGKEGNKEQVKLSGPKVLPEPVKKYLVQQMKKAPELLSNFRTLERSSPKGEKVFDIRLFDEIEAAGKEIEVKNYLSLDEHPELIFYEGWYDGNSKQVQLEEKKELKARPTVPIFTEKEIRQKIEELTQPGSIIFFYLGGSQKFGGPLERGAAIVELNPKYPGEKQKKYIVYVASVDGLEPVSKRDKVFESDDVKQIASWIKDKHHEPYRF